MLKSLGNNEVDFGIFAISNSIGGLVDETMNFLGQYRWKLVATHEIQIQHALMIHPDAEISDLDTIMGHDQAIKQCEENLKKYFPNIETRAGTDALIDNAAIAEAVGNGKLPHSTGSIGHI